MNGVLILDKPAGFTSFDAVAVVRKLSHERKIGHTGTLDPMATGVLPLLLGRAAKALDLLPDTDKVYRAEFKLGERRDTGDVTGKVVETTEAKITREMLENALPAFRGEIMQTPPMYSAVSVNGQRLYDLARKGVEVDRPARSVQVFQLELTAFDEAAQTGSVTVSCSKGTYVRTLIEDFAKAAGTLGAMTALRRTAACGFKEEDATTLHDLELIAQGGELDILLRPIESLFLSYPAVTVSPAQANRFSNGGSLELTRLHISKNKLTDGVRLRVRDPEDAFLGLARVDRAAGELKFLKLFKEETL